MNLPKIPFLRVLFYVVIIAFLFWVGGVFFNLAQETPLQSQNTPPPDATAAIVSTDTEQQALSEPAKEPVFLAEQPIATKSEPPIHQPATNTPSATVSAQSQMAATVVPVARYEYAPLSFEVIHTAAVPAIVNIICLPQKGSGRAGVTGTGIIIDPRGVVLTNAHVAQYIALKDYPTKDSLVCSLRTGSPARPAFNAEILYFPKAWAQEHSSEYDTEFATGTGEHDWALLHITETSPAHTPGKLPIIIPDTRVHAALPNDDLLVTGYPAGFLSSQTIAHDLWMVSTIATLKQLLTFAQYTPDVFSVGGTIVAQGGISGGPAINSWGRLVGIAVTASDGATTDERDLRFVSLSYIDADVQRETGLTLAQFIAGDPTERAAQFYDARKDELVRLLTQQN